MTQPNLQSQPVDFPSNPPAGDQQDNKPTTDDIAQQWLNSNGLDVVPPAPAPVPSAFNAQPAPTPMPSAFNPAPAPTYAQAPAPTSSAFNPAPAPTYAQAPAPSNVPPAYQGDRDSQGFRFDSDADEFLRKGLTEAQLSTYASALPLIKQVIENALSYANSKYYEPRFSEVNTSLQYSTQMMDNQFETSLQQQAPEFYAIRNEQGYQEFLNSRAPMSNRSMRDVLAEAYARYDASAFREFANLYRSYHAKPTTQQTTFTSAGSNMASPARTAANNVATTNGANNTISVRTIERATAEFSAGRLDSAVFESLLRTFKVAQSEGRIVP